MPEFSNYVEGLTAVVGALSGDEIVPVSKDGDAASVTTQQIANLGGGGSAASETTAGIAELATQAETNTGTDDARIVTPLKLANQNFLAPLASPALAGTPTAPTAAAATNTTQVATTAFVQQEIASKVDEETFATLTYGATVTWDCNNRQIPTAKLTATGSFTIDMTNVKDGSRGILKLITNTASAITLTFDTTYTNKSLNTAMTSYTFPALTGQDYYLSWVLEGTTIEWIIGDISKTSAGVSLQRAANQVIASDATIYTAVVFDTENLVNANMWTVSPNPTRIVIPGSGNKRAFVTGWVQWDASATGERRILINKNGASTAFTDGVFSRVIGTTSIPTIVSISGQINCAGGDYLEIMTFQNSTANRNVTASISVSVNDRA